MPVVRTKANARPGEDRAFYTPLSESGCGGGDRFRLTAAFATAATASVLIDGFGTPEFKNLHADSLHV